MNQRTTIEIVVITFESYHYSSAVHQTVIGRLLTIIICHLEMNAKQTTLKGFLQLSSDSEPDDVSQYTPSP